MNHDIAKVPILVDNTMIWHVKLLKSFTWLVYSLVVVVVIYGPLLNVGFTI